MNSFINEYAPFNVRTTPGVNTKISQATTLTAVVLATAAVFIGVSSPDHFAQAGLSVGAGGAMMVHLASPVLLLVAVLVGLVAGVVRAWAASTPREVNNTSLWLLLGAGSALLLGAGFWRIAQQLGAAVASSPSGVQVFACALGGALAVLPVGMLVGQGLGRRWLPTTSTARVREQADAQAQSQEQPQSQALSHVHPCGQLAVWLASVLVAVAALPLVTLLCAPAEFSPSTDLVMGLVVGCGWLVSAWVLTGAAVVGVKVLARTTTAGQATHAAQAPGASGEQDLGGWMWVALPLAMVGAAFACALWLGGYPFPGTALPAPNSSLGQVLANSVVRGVVPALLVVCVAVVVVFAWQLASQVAPRGGAATWLRVVGIGVGVVSAWAFVYYRLFIPFTDAVAVSYHLAATPDFLATRPGMLLPLAVGGIGDGGVSVVLSWSTLGLQVVCGLGVWVGLWSLLSFLRRREHYVLASWMLFALAVVAVLWMLTGIDQVAQASAASIRPAGAASLSGWPGGGDVLLAPDGVRRAHALATLLLSFLAVDGVRQRLHHHTAPNAGSCGPVALVWWCVACALPLSADHWGGLILAGVLGSALLIAAAPTAPEN